MGFRFWFVLFLVVIAMVAEQATRTTANLTIGDEIGEGEETMLDSEASRRILAAGKRYLSYDVMKASLTPCNKRGHSYYSCSNSSRGKVNPYKRACTVITRCYRFTR